jgi:hypothetical protein
MAKIEDISLGSYPPSDLDEEDTEDFDLASELRAKGLTDFTRLDDSNSTFRSIDRELDLDSDDFDFNEDNEDFIYE